MSTIELMLLFVHLCRKSSTSCKSSVLVVVEMGNHSWKLKSPSLSTLLVGASNKLWTEEAAKPHGGTVLEDHTKHIRIDSKSGKPHECAKQRGDLNAFAS